MSQATLSVFTEPQTALSCPNRCQECVRRSGPIQSISGKLKVRCFGSLKDARDGCPSFSAGDDLEIMASFAPPEGYVPKKYAGGRA